jgi:hypothetical protein
MLATTQNAGSIQTEFRVLCQPPHNAKPQFIEATSRDDASAKAVEFYNQTTDWTYAQELRDGQWKTFEKNEG